MVLAFISRFYTFRNVHFFYTISYPKVHLLIVLFTQMCSLRSSLNFQ